jgi:hypothetical protein
MTIIKPFTVDLFHKETFVKEILQQGTYEDIKLEVTITNDSEEYIIPSTAIVRLDMQRYNGSYISDKTCCSVLNNKVYITVTKDMTAVSGRASIKLILTDTATGGSTKTVRFHTLIQEGIIPESAIINTSLFPILEDALLDISDSINSVITFKNEEEIRVNNENIRKGNETTRLNDENTRANNENIRENNETSRINNENARLVYEEYDDTKDYIPGNKVSYNGSSFVNKVSCVGILPTESTENWLCIAAAGGSVSNATQLLISDTGNYFITKNTNAALQQLGNITTDHSSQLSQKANLVDLNATNAAVSLKVNKDEITVGSYPLEVNGWTYLYANLPTPSTSNKSGYLYCTDGDGTHGSGNYVSNGISWYYGGTGDKGYNILKADSVQKPLYEIDTVSHAGYYSVSGFVSNTNYASKSLVVTAGDTIYVTCSGNVAFMPYYMYKADGSVYQMNWETQHCYDYKIVIPSGITLIGLNYLEAPAGMSSITVKKMTYGFKIETLQTDVGTLQTDASLLQADVDMLQSTIDDISAYGLSSVNTNNIVSDYTYWFGLDSEAYSKNSIHVNGSETHWSPIFIKKPVKFVPPLPAILVLGKCGHWSFGVHIDGTDTGKIYAVYDGNWNYVKTDAKILDINYNVNSTYLMIPKSNCVYFFQDNVFKGKFIFTDGIISELETKAVTTFNNIEYYAGIISSGTFTFFVDNNIPQPNYEYPFAYSLGCALGDSQTTNGYYLESLLLNSKASWIEKQGVAGTNITSTGNGSSFVERAKNIDWTLYKFAVVCGGTNDWEHNIPIGNIDDTVTSTLYGAVKEIINYVLTNNPKITLLFYTPTQRKNSNIDVNSLGYKLVDYVDAIIDACNEQSIFVRDLYRGSGLNHYTADTLTLDGLHWTQSFGARMGRVMANDANSLSCV